MLRNYLERRRAKKTFEKLVDPKVVGEVLDGRFDKTSLEESHIEFVIIFVSGNAPEQISQLVGRAIKIAIDHHAWIDGLSASVIVAAWGVSPGCPVKPGARERLVVALLSQLGHSIKIVHAGGLGCCGIFGGGECLRYSFAFPNFDAVLSLLGQTELGASQEFKSSVDCDAGLG
jgi:hypothetical protein